MHIVYFSPTGGTRKAAYIIGKEIDPQATEIDITDHTPLLHQKIQNIH